MLLLSSGTVKRRLGRPERGGALYLVAELDPRFLNGGMTGGLLLFYDNPENRRPVNRYVISQLEGNLIFANLEDSDHAYFAFIITNLAMAERVVNLALAHGGVSAGRVDIVQDLTSLYGVYEEQLERLEHSPAYAPSVRLPRSR